jgi:branched-chain amino acid transport system permease protein
MPLADRRWRWALGAAMLIALPLLAPPYWLFLATTAVISSVTMLGVGVVSGRAGMLSLCQLSFAAVGAWTVAWLQRSGPGLPFLLQLLLAGLVAAPFGLLLGLPALRLRGVSLAVVTLAFAGALDILLTRFGFPGVSAGVPVRRDPLLTSDVAYFWLCVAVAGGLTWTLVRIDRGRLGSAWLAVSRSERAAAAMGLSVTQAKLSAFAVGATIAGLGGGLLAGQLGMLSAINFAPIGSLVVFAVGTMIGVRYAEGAIIAGVMVVVLPELLRRLGLPPDLGDLVFALGAIHALSSGMSLLDHRRQQRAAARAETLPAPEHAPLSTGEPPTAPAPQQPPALAVAGLQVRYGEVRALDGVSLVAEAGRVTALIGPNGAGKSTLVDAVSGFLAHYTGTVTVAGKALDALGAVERACAGVRRTFQQGRAIPELSVGQYVRLAAQRPLDNSELNELLAFFGCSHPDTLVALVPVGTRRLAEVAAVIAARPQIALLDEPAAGLSSTESHILAERIAAIPARFGCAVLLIEHDLELVRAAASMVVVLDFGRVIAAGPPAAVLRDPAVVAAYLGGEADAPALGATAVPQEA